MKDLAVLTPPLLMAAVVIFAIVAFLRHELGRGKADQPSDPATPGRAAGGGPETTPDDGPGEHPDISPR